MNSPLKAWVRALEATAPIERGCAPVLPLLIDELAERFGAAPALVSKDAALSYRLPKRYGFITLGVANLLDKHFQYADSDAVTAFIQNATIQPSRTVFGKITFEFP